MVLKKCPECKRYTFKKICDACSSKTKDAHYKFIDTKRIRFKKEEII